MCRFFKEHNVKLKRTLYAFSLLISAGLLINEIDDKALKCLIPAVLLIALLAGYGEAKEEETDKFDHVLRV